MTASDPIRVTIVVPVHNRRAITLQGLTSLAALDVRGIAVRTVVVDDGSIDGTATAVAAAFPDVELLYGDGTLFYAGATNRGVEAALAHGAEYVMQVNDDGLFHPQVLQRLVACARDHPRAVVGALLTLWDDRGRVCQVAPRWSTTYGGWRHFAPRVGELPDAPFAVDLLAGNCVLVPAAAIRDVGPLDAERFAQHHADAEFAVRLRHAGWILLVEPSARVSMQPNTSPRPLRAMAPRERVRALVGPPGRPGYAGNLRLLLRMHQRTAPTRTQAVLASAVHVGRLALRALGARGWPGPSGPLDRRLEVVRATSSARSPEARLEDGFERGA